MSINKVSKKQIDYILTFATKKGIGYPIHYFKCENIDTLIKEATDTKTYLSIVENNRLYIRDENLDEVGQKLLNENLISYSTRYRETMKETQYKYNFVPETDALTTLALIKDLMSQSAESPDYKQSEAHRISQSILNTTIYSLKGIDEALAKFRTSEVF